MDLSSVPEALVTIRAARDKMKGKSEGKGELAVSFSGRGKGKWRKPNSAKLLWDKLAARKAKPTLVVERIGQFGVFPQCSNLREHSVCTNSVSNFRCSLLDAHIPVSPVVTGTVHPTPSADSQEFFCSVMENSEPSASKSDL